MWMDEWRGAAGSVITIAHHIISHTQYGQTRINYTNQSKCCSQISHFESNVFVNKLIGKESWTFETINNRQQAKFFHTYGILFSSLPHWCCCDHTVLGIYLSSPNMKNFITMLYLKIWHEKHQYEDYPNLR